MGTRTRLFVVGEPGQTDEGKHGVLLLWTNDCGVYFVDRRMREATGPLRPLITDNPHLLENDPGYLNRLASVGSRLFRAWRYGDWNITEGAYFPEFERRRHVIPPFPIPSFWTKYRSMDWGSSAPFAVHWWTVVQEDTVHAGHILPRRAIVACREWHGALKLNLGLKLTAQEVANGIVERETDFRGKRENISFGVIGSVGLGGDIRSIDGRDASTAGRYLQARRQPKNGAKP